MTPWFISPKRTALRWLAAPAMAWTCRSRARWRIIETAFNVAMGVYQHPTENRTFYAPDREPTVDLPFPLWHISGLDNYSIPHPAIVHREPRCTRSVQSNATTGSCPSGSYLRQRHESGLLRRNGSHRHRPEPRVAGVSTATDLADLNTYFTNTGQTNRVPITRHLHRWNQPELRLFERL